MHVANQGMRLTLPLQPSSCPAKLLQPQLQSKLHPSILQKPGTWYVATATRQHRQISLPVVSQNGCRAALQTGSQCSSQCAILQNAKDEMWLVSCCMHCGLQLLPNDAGQPHLPPQVLQHHRASTTSGQPLRWTVGVKPRAPKPAAAGIEIWACRWQVKTHAGCAIGVLTHAHPHTNRKSQGNGNTTDCIPQDNAYTHNRVGACTPAGCDNAHSWTHT
jgi:hypothetical protein